MHGPAANRRASCGSDSAVIRKLALCLERQSKLCIDAEPAHLSGCYARPSRDQAVPGSDQAVTKPCLAAVTKQCLAVKRDQALPCSDDERRADMESGSHVVFSNLFAFISFIP